MRDVLPGRKASDGMSRVPFLNETASRTSSASGYDILLDSEKETWPRRKQSFAQRASRFIICTMAAVLVLETILLARTVRLPHKGPVPEFSIVEKVLHASPEWEFSPVAHELWMTFIDDSGMVTVPNWQSYGLKQGLETSEPGAGVYGVTFTHEYHCMRMIRTALVGLMTRDPDAMRELYVANTSVALPNHRLGHLFHCVDYIKQNILCQADMTIEWRADNNPAQIDGYGPPHQCKNWDEVRSWMVANHPTDPLYQNPHAGHAGMH